jgi:hypothetical protein
MATDPAKQADINIVTVRMAFMKYLFSQAEYPRQAGSDYVSIYGGVE